MKFRTIALSLVAVALIAAPAISFAQGRLGGPGACGNEPLGMGMGPGHGGHGGPGFGLLNGPMGERLGLSDDQKAQIETILENASSQVESLREQLESARESFHATHEPGSYDEAQARAFAQSQSAIHAELMVQRMKTHADIFNLLTPEQQEQMKEIRELLGDFGGPRHGGRRGFGRR